MTETPAWITESYRSHAGHVFRRARRLLGSDADAHEVVQDVFLSLLERPEQYAGRSSFTTFLYSATTHACLNRIRSQKNRARLLERENLQMLDAADGSAPLSPEKRIELHGLLRRMPEEWARAAVYHYLDDLGHEEIARLLECSRRHVGNLLARVAAWAEKDQTHAD
jgi:RNA polymerase sigma-70 factor (ECF subfamily)